MKKRNKYILKNLKRIIAILVLLVVVVGGVGLLVPGKETVAEDKYPIMGPSNVTIGQLMNYYNSVTSYPGAYIFTDAPTLDSFCQMYIDECNAEGVRVEVAFCQAMNETNFLRYTGRVPIWSLNFAGIGATDSTQEYNVFSSVREGIRAQVQHLKAYASTDNLNNWCVDPRFGYVNRGCAPYVEDLGGKWASNPSYGYDIRNNFMARLGTFNGFCTMYNGVEYASVYDPNYYLTHYADLQAAFANDGYALIAHFVNNGMSEGRVAQDWFNVHIYKNNYVDLRNAFGYDLRSYFYHYIYYGRNEGRQGWASNGSTDKVTKWNGIDCSAVYDYNYYVSHNPDVRAVFGNDDIAVINHFVTCGMNEGRQGNASFNLEGYKNRYLDLRRAFGPFNAWYYVHYIANGIREGRDTSYIDRVVEGEHVFFGVDFSPVYDFRYYQDNNPDVKAAFGNDDVATFAHFLLYGMNEGRKASPSFDLWTYIVNYGDLRNAFGWNISSYYLHYINLGRFEGRVAV